MPAYGGKLGLEDYASLLLRRFYHHTLIGNVCLLPINDKTILSTKFDRHQITMGFIFSRLWNYHWFHRTLS